MTDPLGESQVIPYLISLSKYGYEFTILSCDKPDRFKKNKTNITELLKPFSIKWVSIPYHKNPPIFSTLYDFYRLKIKASQLHKLLKFDMVHTRPGVPALLGLWMKKKWGIKFLNDIREFYADSRVEGGMWNTNSFLYKSIYDFFKRKENEAVSENDGIVCLTNAAKKVIQSWPQYADEIPLEVIPCSVSLELFNPGKINSSSTTKLKNELGIKDDDFIVSYLGSIGGWYLTDELMQFYKVLSDKIPKAKFLFISPNGHDVIARAAKKVNLSPDKIIVKYGQRNEVPALLSISKYSVFFIKPCYSKTSSSPTKHGEIMAMGIPVITNSGVGDVEEIVDKYQAGIILKQLNKSEFLKATDTITSDIIFDGALIRQGAQDYYALENAAEKYSKVYQKIFGNK